MKLPTKIVVAIVAVIAVIAFFQIDFSAEPTNTGQEGNQPEPLVVAASHTKGLATFEVAAKTAGLIDTLNQGGPYTLFAPTDSAFSALPEGRYSSIMNADNNERLRKIVKYHAVEGIFRGDDLEDGDTLSTLNGQKLVITRKDNVPAVNGNELAQTDIPASNGVIHVIHTLLLPEGEAGN